MCTLKLVLYTACIFAIVLTVSANLLNKRVPDNQFMAQSRYGRAGNGNGGGREKEVTPRTDKFFLGSRYGKRSNIIPPNSSLFYPVSLCNIENNLSCAYTGISNLYHCIQRKETSGEMNASQ